MFLFNSRQITISIIVSTFLLIAANTQAKEEKPPKEIADGLVLKEGTKADIAYVRPNVDWSKYQSVYFRQLKVTDEARDATPKHNKRRRGHLGESWVIPEKDITMMQAEFSRIMKEELADGKLKVVDTPQKDTLVIVPVIIDVYLNAPIEKTRKTHQSRGGTFSEGAGSLTIAATFGDGEDMRVLAYTVDKKYPSSVWSRNTRVQNVSDMKRVFRSWAKMLNKSLSKIKE